MNQNLDTGVVRTRKFRLLLRLLLIQYDGLTVIFIDLSKITIDIHLLTSAG